jgi:DNA-binding MarR family transcriptional regulator
MPARQSSCQRGRRVSAEQATLTGQRIITVFQEDRSQLRELGRLAPSSLLVQEALQSKPLATLATLTKTTGLTTPTVTLALRELQRLGIVRETTGRVRGRIYSYLRYLEALNTETEASLHRSRPVIGSVPRASRVKPRIRRR